MHDVLANGARIPAIGFGTYGMERADMLRMIPAALRGGFRHTNTAQIYRNEAEVGECTVSSGIPRSELFITTKVWVENYPARRFAASVDESLRKLRTDYIDLLLLHWPHDGVPLAEQIGQLNETVRAGKVRHIGVSNFNRKLLQQAIDLSAVPLVTNQFECHPTSTSRCYRARHARPAPYWRLVNETVFGNEPKDAGALRTQSARMRPT